MKYIPNNTLAHYQAAPQFKQIQLGHLPVSVLGETTKAFRVDCGQVYPDESALTFYATNHLAAIVKKMFTPNEPLPPWAEEVMRVYMDVLAQQGKRLLHYLMSITTREARHLRAMPQEWHEKVAAQFGQPFNEFLTKKITPCGESDAVDNFMYTPPVSTCEQYSRGLTWVFQKGKWNSGYGGKAWGKIAECAEMFLLGKISMEMMVDTSYTLAHNNGPMFNKGMMYSMYSHSFLMILDVQRSGQIPEMVLDDDKYGLVAIPKELKKLVEMVKKECPDEFGSWVDWYKVEALGSLKKYPQYKELQLKKHGAAMNPLKFGNKTAKVIGQLAIFPGEVVQIVERMKA